jgi:hypothetical protein
VREDFLPEFYGALDARFVTEEFITGGRTGRRDRASRG